MAPRSSAEARDEIILSQIYALSALISDEKERAELQRPVTEVLQRLFPG